MEKKLGIYICTGCSIGESLDIEKLATIAKNSLGAAKVETHEFLCGPEGAGLIRADIENEGINTVVVAACSPRVNFNTFKFEGVIVERVNVREHVVWAHPANDEDTQMLAEDYLRMGTAKAKKIELPAPHIEEETNRTVLVIGGGVSGMTAAIETAKAGYGAIIVEKEAQLGGFMGKMHKRLPTSYPFAKLEDTGVSALAQQIQADAATKRPITPSITSKPAEP